MQQIVSKVLWITGASSGIGEALCYELSRMGCRLIISSRNEAMLREVKGRCRYPEKVKVLPLDLEAREAMPALTEEALLCYGEIHVLIHNAGVSQRSLILNTQMAVYEKLMDVNYLGTIALTKAILPYFINSRQGHFVTVTSLMGKLGSPLRSGYCGAKHALHGFFDVLRMEHEKDGVQVTLICPGFVQTNIARNAITAEGLPQKKEDAATAGGMPPERFAVKMIQAIARKKFEVYIGGKETKAIYLKRFFPKLLHRVILKSRVV